MDETKNSTTAQAPASEQRTPPLPLLERHQQKTSRRVSRVKTILLIAGAIVAAIAIWEIFFATPKLPASIIAVSGRIEGDDSAVASKTSGKILEVTVREGDTVTAGQVIARLDDAQVRAREDQARAALADAQSKMQSAREQIGVLQDQLRQNQLQSGQSTMDAAGRVRQAQADLTAAQADLTQQEAALRLAEFNRDAYTRLAKTGAASTQQGLQAEVQADQQAAAVAAAQRRVEAARGALTTAQANLDNPKIRDRANFQHARANFTAAIDDCRRKSANGAGPGATRGSGSGSSRFDCARAVRRNGAHPRGRTWRSGASGNCNCDAARPFKSVSARICSRR